MSGWRAIVEEIRRDNRSGATALLRRAGDALVLAADSVPEAGSGWRTEIRSAARAVAGVRPAMGAPCRLASAALEAAEAAPSPEEAGHAAREAVRRFIARVEQDASAIGVRAAALIHPGDTVLTISASSLVERAILAAGPVGRVICLESRPALEGGALAARLAAHGLNVTLVSDGAGPRFVEDSRLVLVGGDTLLPNGLIHKVGTLGLALAARHEGVAIYTLVGEEKWLPAPVRGALDDGGPPGELLADPPRGLTVANPYFDRAPLDLLDGVVTTTGILAPAEAGRRARRVAVGPTLRDLLDPH